MQCGISFGTSSQPHRHHTMCPPISPLFQIILSDVAHADLQLYAGRSNRAVCICNHAHNLIACVLLLLVHCFVHCWETHCLVPNTQHPATTSPNLLKHTLPPKVKKYQQPNRALPHTHTLNRICGVPAHANMARLCACAIISVCERVNIKCIMQS